MPLKPVQAKYSHSPKENHVWRQYANKKIKNANGKFEDAPPSSEDQIISLKTFLTDVVENWDTYKIPPANFEDREYISLARISPDKQAEWLIGFIKKHWLTRYKGALILE